MGKRGPAPKPTALKLLEGNPGKRPLNRREPKAAVLKTMPAAPNWLPAAGRDLWSRRGPDLIAYRVLTALDLEAFEALCLHYAEWRAAEGKIKRIGALGQTDSGYEFLHPWVTIARQRYHDFVMMVKEFGMTPASRSRIEIGEPEKAVDALTAFQLSVTHRAPGRRAERSGKGTGK